uniref:Uncharacterized protein n=1 Tax=Oryza glumipatula TaxID=40148 RepID=A0A0E0ACP2_9ORYZ
MQDSSPRHPRMGAEETTWRRGRCRWRRCRQQQGGNNRWEGRCAVGYGGRSAADDDARSRRSVSMPRDGRQEADATRSAMEGSHCRQRLVRWLRVEGVRRP